MEKIKLKKSAAQLKDRESGVILNFGNETVAGRLMSMGVLPGSTVQLIRKAPLGGACYLKINRQLFAVRKEEAQCIILK